MKWIRKLIIQLLLTVVSIILISGVPDLFIHKNFSSYLKKVRDVFMELIHIDQMTYLNQGTKRLFLPDILEPYIYSVTILFGALFIAYCLAQVLTWCTELSPDIIKRFVKQVVGFLEAMPDLLVYALVQMGIVLIYKKTGVLVSNVSSLGSEKIYAVPILCLTLLPFVYFYKMMILLTEDELKKSYFETGIAKGMNKLYILIVHITRNTSEGLFHFSKSVLWFMISNLLLVEIIFNIHGITHYMYHDFRPQMLAACLILLVIPFFIVYAFIEWIVSRFTKRGEVL